MKNGFVQVGDSIPFVNQTWNAQGCHSLKPHCESFLETLLADIQEIGHCRMSELETNRSRSVR